MSDQLTPKQEAFVAEYLKLKNATKAYIAAGYSPKGADTSAARLLGNARIAKRVAEALTRIAKEAEETAEKNLRLLGVIRDRCMTAEPVLLEGVPTGEWKFDSRGAIAAIKLIGDHIGMWEKKDGGRSPSDSPLPPTPYEERQIIDTILGKRRDDDAIQIESPAKILIQPTPRDCETVGSGDTELPDFAGGQIPDPQSGS